MEKPSPDFAPRPAALHVGAWLAMAAFFFALLATTPIPLGANAGLVVGNFGLLAALFYGHTWLVDRFWEAGRFGGFAVRSLLFFALNCTLRFLVSAYFFGEKMGIGATTLFNPSVRLGLFVFITGFLFMVVAVVFQLLVNRTRRERQGLALLAEQRAAQLQLLKAQMNPHFLFNALNNLYSLTVQKSDAAPAMLLKLSDLLRYVIYDSRLAEVPLGREVGELRRFIELFQMGLERPADIRLDISGDLDRRAVEPMMLMPLVENCFKHGNLAAGGAAAYCEIKLENRPDSLLFSTRNSFDPADRQKDRAGGVGLENIGRRLALRYPGRHRFSFHGKGGVFEVSLEISFQ